MKKIVIIIFAFTAITLSQSNFVSFAKENNSISLKTETKNNVGIIKNDDSEGKNKFQLRIDDRKNNFMIKGVITASAANTLTIKNTLINIDSSVTGDIKIIGNPVIGSYAIIKGVNLKPNLYATKIVISQRNEHEIDDYDEDENENEEYISPTPSINPSITATPTPTVIATESAEIDSPQNLSEDLGLIIERVQEFLNYLKDIASKI